MKKISLFLFLFAYVALISKADPPAEDFFTGNWELFIKDLPQGDVTMLMSLERKEGKLVGMLKNKETGADIAVITQVDEKENSIMVYFFAEGYDVYMSLIPKEEKGLTGMLMDAFPVTGTRVK